MEKTGLRRRETLLCGHPLQYWGDLKLRYGRADGMPRFLQSMVVDVKSSISAAHNVVILLGRRL